jgi:hypothetical protein
MDFGSIATRFFAGEFLPITECEPRDFPHCPELAGTRLGALLKSFRPGSPLIDAYNRLLGADRLGIEDGVILICEESQAVSYWGVRASDRELAKPPVLRTENVEPPEWEVEFEELDAYLSVFCFWQAMNGAWPYHGYAKRKGGLGAGLRGVLEPIEIPSNTTGLTFYCEGSSLLVAESPAEVFVAARSEVEWQSIARRIPKLVALHDA